MDHRYEMINDNLLLRPLKYNDIEPLRLLRNEQRFYFSDNNLISKQQQEEWFKAYLAKDDDIMFAITTIDKPEAFCGAIALYHIDYKSKMAEFGRVVIDKTLLAEKGTGTKAIKTVCRFGFETLHLNIIKAVVLKSNLRAIKAEINAGFQIIGEKDDVYNIEMTKRSFLERLLL